MEVLISSQRRETCGKSKKLVCFPLSLQAKRCLDMTQYPQVQAEGKSLSDLKKKTLTQETTNPQTKTPPKLPVK